MIRGVHGRWQTNIGAPTLSRCNLATLYLTFTLASTLKHLVLWKGVFEITKYMDSYILRANGFSIFFYKLSR